MSKIIPKIKPSQLNTAIAVISGISALFGIHVYFQRKHERKLESDILELDKNIKQIQLNKLIK